MDKVNKITVYCNMINVHHNMSIYVYILGILNYINILVHSSQKFIKKWIYT